MVSLSVDPDVSHGGGMLQLLIYLFFLSLLYSLTGYDTEKAWRKEGQKLATTNPRFVSRPASHIPQVLTAATLSVGGGGGGGIKPGAATTATTKTTLTPGQSTESDLKKAISIQLQNALKLVMSQNPTSTSVTTTRSTLTTTLRPQSAPVTPVKAPISSTVTSSPSKTPVTSSIVSPLKTGGTVTCKSITAKVVASSSPRKNVSVGTNPPTSVVAVTLQAAKPKSGSPGPGVDGASVKKSKLSAIESLLCEETISPKSSPGPAPSPGVVKDELPATPPDGTPMKKKADVLKTEVEKRQPMEGAAVSSQKVEPSAADSQKVKQPSAPTGANESKTDPKPMESVETKSVQKIETRSTDDVETKPTVDMLSGQELTVQKEKSTEVPENEKKPLPPSDDIKTTTPQPPGSSDAQPSTPEDTVSKQTVHEIAPVTNNEAMVKTESRTVLSANIEVSRPANVEFSKPLPPPSLAIPTAPAAPEKEDTMVKKGTRKRSPSPSLNEPPPAKKPAIAPQQDVVVASPSIIATSANQPPSAKGQEAIELPTSKVVPPSSSSTSDQPQKQAIATHTAVTIPPTSAVSDLPPPPKKPAIEPQKDVTSSIPSIFTSVPTALFSASTTTAQASIPVTGASTVTVTVLGSSMDMGNNIRDGATTGSFNITPPPSSSELPSEVNTDSLIQSLCSDSTSFEDPLDVSVLASQLGIDSVDSPVFNLSGFLSMLQPDLSVLTPEEQSTAVGDKLLGGDISSGEKQSSGTITEGVTSGGEKQSSADGGQRLGDVSSGAKNQKPPKETLGESTAETTTTSFLATQTLPAAVSTSLQPEVAAPVPTVPSALELPVVPSPPPSSTSAPPASLLPAPVAEPITTTSVSILSPAMFPEEPIPPRPLVLGIPTDPPSLELGQTAPPPPLLGTPISPTPLTPTPLTPLGEGLLDLSDISSLMDESEVMEGISQDVFESIEKLVNLDEQSTNATWK